MNDCVNGDIRDVLPELVNGTLPAADLLRIQEHVRSCGDCAAEVELLRTARAAMRLAPTMDTTRIAAAVQASTAQRLAARRVPARVARLASLSLILVLGAIGVWASRDSRDTSSAAIQTPVVTAEGPVGVAAAVPAASVVGSRAVQAPAQLALGGDMTQLGDEDLLALMAELSALEAMPGEELASLSIEPVMPVDQEGL